MQPLSIEGFPISPQQKRLWLLQQETNHHPYRVQCAVLLEGNIEHSILEKAIHNVWAKYEILRTSFPTLAEMAVPLQAIEEEVSIKFNYSDWHNLDTERQQINIEALFQEQNKLYFDLKKGFTSQIDVIKKSNNQYLLLIAISAICADRISMHHLLRDISVTYLQEHELKDMPLQYADIATWQNEILIGEEAETAKDYWCNQKISNLLIGKLPNEQKVNRRAIFEPKVISISFDSVITTNIAAIAQKYTVDISTVFMACWQILLWRLANKSEVVLALCCDGRNYEELQPAVGLLAKYLPVSIELQDNYIFSDVLRQLDKQINELYQWQDFFNSEDFFIEDKNSQELPFLPFAFEFVSQPGKYSAGEVSFSIQKIYSCIERFKVKVFCWDRGDSIAAELYYDSNLFNQENIDRLVAQFQTLLTSVINNSKIAIAQLEILSPQERQQLLVDNNTKTTPAPYQCIHHWIEAQVNRTPANIAIVFEAQQLTYQELNTKANKLAAHLLSKGVKPETVIALCVERSLDVAIGILGILKAGAAYLPLEPSLPEEALAFRLEDAQVSLLLTQKHLVNKIQPDENKVQIICIDNLDNRLPQSNIPSPVTSENLAYVIYTSGSTGKPKGVAVEHRQLLNYVNGILEKLDLPDAASFATVSTLAADLGNTAIFSALCTGGCLHIISEECATDPVAFADYNHRYSLDCLKIVPSHLSALLTGSNPEKILPRQRLILGGEAATWELIRRVSELAPCKIFNHYGPTETTVGVLTYPVDKASTALSNTVPLGRPLGNTQIYLLDNYYQPVPLGLPGEIYIGGDSVARGYINRPELTTERFIRNPFITVSGARLYKTGDLGRYLPDSNLEFLGRIDDQVKLHGFRIELGEIEAILRQHPQVREVVVAVREEHPGKKQLVAYIVPKEQIANLQSLELRDFLKQKLPEYMLPSQFIPLKALPLTANGKIDRKALPAPDAVKLELQATFVAPRTHAEIALAKIWAKLLGLEQVSIHDNFFELGGDSIISIQAIAQANQVGLRLTPKQIFEHQTIAKLAVVAETTTSKTESEQGLVIGSVPLTPIQHSFFAQNISEPHHWNQSFLLELQQWIDPTLLQQVIQYLLSHHDALRLHFRPQVNGWQSFNAGVDKEIPFTKFDFSDLPHEQQKAAIEAKATELQASLDLSNSPLLRVALFNLGSHQNSRLLIMIHHLAVDGVSWRILLSDLQTALKQLQQNQAINLPAKTTSFQQWANHLQKYARIETLHSQLDYWCSESRKLTSLPVDYMGDLNTVSTSKTLSVFLNEAETTALLQEVPAVYHTQVNDVLLTALTKTFVEWTGEQTLLVNLEGHGREDIFSDVDLSRTVGWFTTVFPVLLSLENTFNIDDALKAIKEQLRSIPNRGFDYGVLRYLCSDTTETLAAMPSAQVCFNYLGQFDQVLQSSLFTIAPESSGITRSPLGNRRYLLEINGFVTGGCLQLDWTYSDRMHKHVTVSRLAKNFLQALREIICHCQSTDTGGYTPSDFSKARVSQKDLDFLLTKINRESEK